MEFTLDFNAVFQCGVQHIYIYNAEICVYVPVKDEKILIQSTYKFLVGVKNRGGH